VRIGVVLACLLAVTAGTLTGQSWVQKIYGPGLGNPLAVNPLNSDVLYAAVGSNRVFVSRDRGYTWFNYGGLVTGGGIIKSVSVSPLDTNRMLVGVESSVGFPDRIMKTTDAGLSWVETWSGTFSYYGQPVEFSPLHPDTVYTMGLDTLYRSVDFGSTWDTVCTGRGFNAWCDAALRPDSSAVMYIGDNLSGIWKTSDYGATWRKVYSTIGEIPSIAIDPLNPRVAYAGKFGGGGGLVKSSDWGETWHTLSVPSGNHDAWWVTCSPVHPGYLYYGTYTGDTAALGIYFSRDSGTHWSKIADGLPPGSWLNYGLLALDSLTLLALQANGLYKYQYPTAIHLTAPAGGEFWLTGTEHAISWTSTGLYYLKLEYSSDNGASWNAIADSVPASQTSWLWTTPLSPSDSCLVRVSDALFTPTSAVCGSVFTITDAFLTVTAPNGGEEWDAGSIQKISWTAVSFDSLTIGFSTDSGSSWATIAAVPAAAGAFEWTVPAVQTAAALVRLRAVADTGVTDLSDAVFSILVPAEFTGGIRLHDAGTGSDTLFFGNIPGATDGLDPSLGETELPLVPPVGSFDVRWIIPGTNGVKLDFRDTITGPGELHRFTARLQPGPGGFPFSLSWDRDSLRAGTLVMRDLLTAGSRYAVNMRRDSALAVADQSVDEVEILDCPGTPVSIPGNGSWRLVSIPVESGERLTKRIFPFSPGGAYGYSAGYVRRDTLVAGEGYWIRTGQVTLTGCPLQAETTSVARGWNIVGALTHPLPAGSLVSVPESLVVSPFYGFGPSGYYLADSLIPGEAYWVKCRDSGSLVLMESGAEPAGVKPAPGARPRMNTLTLRGGGAVSTLYFGPGSIQGYLEAPPPPPDSRVQYTINGSEIGVFHGPATIYPIEYEIAGNMSEKEIFFSWHVEIQENFDYILIEKAGTQEDSKALLKGDGSVSITISPESGIFLKIVPRGIGNGETPAAFSMGEFYPNPFNPSTRVLLTLPSESEVSYTIYNLLGEKIVSSADHDYGAGVHTLEWDARRGDGTPIGSGVYFFDLTAVAGPDAGGRTFRAVRKVALVR
jgi:hypothetical protein